MDPVTVAEVRAHIAFLRAVHVSSSRGEGSLLTDGTRLRNAVRAYIPWLAFHAARASNGRAVLVERAPPLDAAWIWHMHRLDSRDYARTCAAFGAFVAPAPGVGFAASDSVATPAAIDDGKATEHELVAAAIRHAGFLWQVSGAAYNDDAFLERAIARYERFVTLCASSTGGLLAPPIDVDLVWHTHILRGADYAAESAAMRGGAGALDHDNGEGMSGGPLLDAARARTLDAWRDGNDGNDGLAVEAVPSDAQGRGDPPPWWFGGGDGVLVVGGFLDADEIAAIVAQMPDPSEAVVGGGGVTGGRGHGKDARAHVEVDARVEGRACFPV